MIETLFSPQLRLLILPTILLGFAAFSVAQTPAVETKTEKITAEKPLGEVDRWINENAGKEPLMALVWRIAALKMISKEWSADEFCHAKASVSTHRQNGEGFWDRKGSTDNR